VLVFRIAAERYAGDLSGGGARRSGGRWNTPGTAVVYAARSRALACLELLVHVSDLTLQPPMRLDTLELPEGEQSESFEAAELPEGWNTLVPAAATQQVGDRWVREGRTLLVEVPSVIIPEESNVLLNPSHPAMEEVKIAAMREFRFDLRLG
jgi:RES domain-containing protein